jgi:hypothetical protein
MLIYFARGKRLLLLLYTADEETRMSDKETELLGAGRVLSCKTGLAADLVHKMTCRTA